MTLLMGGLMMQKLFFCTIIFKQNASLELNYQGKLQLGALTATSIVAVEVAIATVISLLVFVVAYF